MSKENILSTELKTETFLHLRDTGIAVNYHVVKKTIAFDTVKVTTVVNYNRTNAHQVLNAVHLPVESRKIRCLENFCPTCKSTHLYLYSIFHDKNWY